MTCEYIVRDGHTNQQRECGAPAVFRGIKPPKLHYCAEHGHFVSRQNPKWAIAVKPLQKDQQP